MRGPSGGLDPRGGTRSRAALASRRGKALWAASAGLLLLAAAGVAAWLHSRVGPARDASFAVPCPDPRGGCLEVSNAGPATARFTLRLNGRGFAQSAEELAEEAAALPADYPGEPLQRKVWRYTRSQVVLSRPVSRRPWYNHPCLLANSTGFGWCDDMASMNCFLWQQLGYPSRCWYLTGHVVSEVLVAGRWEMYDSDMGVCYLRPDGRVAGVEDLMANPGLVRGSALLLRPQSLRSARSAQTEATEAIYASRGDNKPVQLPQQPAPLPFRFVLPGGGRIRFPLPPGAAATREHYGDEAGGAAECALLEVRVPRGWSGTLPMPLILHSVEGRGEIAWEGATYPVGSSQLSALLRSWSPPHGALEVRARGELRCFYYVNPRRFRLEANNDVILRGHGLEGCAVGWAPRPGGAGGGRG